jgi:hypothetical protein
MVHRLGGKALKHQESYRVVLAVQMSDERVPFVVAWSDIDNRLSGQGDSYIGLPSALFQEQGQIKIPSSYLVLSGSRHDGIRRIFGV